MADNDYAAALAAAQELDQYDDETLIRELGKRVEDANLPGGEQRKLAFRAEFVDTSATQGWEFLEDVGRTWRRTLEKELMEFLCPKDSTERDKLLSGKSGVNPKIETRKLGTIFIEWEGTQIVRK